MKRSVIFLTFLSLVTLWTTKGYTGQSELQGLLIGAGSGAVIGHVLGGDSESAIIGSALGGIIGVTAGSIHAGNYHRPASFPHHRYNQPNRHLWNNKWKGYRHHGPYHKHYPQCKVIKKRIFKHGHSYFVTKRICSDRERYNHNNYNNHGWRY